MDAPKGPLLRRLAAHALLAAFASVVLPPLPAHAAEDGCKLTRQQKTAAVKAFRQLYPIYQDERCLNCHGAMNPFSPNTDHPGGWVNIRKAARELLTNANLPADLVSMDDTSRAAELQALSEIAASDKNKDVENAITDNDVIRMKYPAAMQEACRECHVDAWFIPMSQNYFVGRDWKALCVHMKTGLEPPTPDHFLGHMQSDPQVILGFRGQRGMKEPTTAEPPAMPFDTMAKHANAWVEAMDAQFHQPPQCGCEVDGIALEIRHRLYTDPQSKSARAGFAQFDGTVVIDVLLQKEDGPGDPIYRDELTVLRPLVVRHVTPSFLKCAGSGKREEYWTVTARVDEEKQSMQLHFSFTEEAEEAEWTCTGPGYSNTDTLNVDVHGMLKTLNMPVASGSVGEASERGVKAIESITVTVVDSPVEQ